MTGLDWLYYRNLFHRNRAVKCCIHENLEMTACWILKSKAVSWKVAMYVAAQGG